MVEMSIVQTYRDHNSVDEVVEHILTFRIQRDSASGRVAKKKVDNDKLKKLAGNTAIQFETFRDYADVNFRYPRLTGLVSYKGRRLVLSDKKLPVIDAILAKGPKIIGMDHVKYLSQLWVGAELPTDNETTVREEISRFRQLILDSGVPEDAIPQMLETQNVADLNQTRIQLEGQYQHELEKKYASEQGQDEQVKETIAYLKLIDKQPIDAEIYDLEIDDAPANLEWATWRAFLAINHLVNKPHKARRFRVDQDFFPMGCAPGNGPDLIFEFENYVLVVEAV